MCEAIECMTLELHQIATLLDNKQLSGEELDKVTAQVADIERRKEHILALLHMCTIAARAVDDYKFRSEEEMHFCIIP